MPGIKSMGKYRLMLLGLGLAFAFPSSSAPVGDASAQDKVERLTDAIIEVLPMGRIFELAATDNPQWPMHERPDAVTAAQLTCLRSELSTEGYRRAKRVEVAAYAEANPSRLDEDLRLLESGAAALMGKLVLGGATSSRNGQPFDEKAVLGTATNEQALGLVKFMTDPNFAELRKLAGLGDTLASGRSKSENEAAGEQLGRSLGAQQMIKAMGTCNVPPSAYL